MPDLGMTITAGAPREIEEIVMSEPTPRQDPTKPLPPTNPAPKGSKPPQEDDPVTATNPDNPAF